MAERGEMQTDLMYSYLKKEQAQKDQRQLMIYLGILTRQQTNGILFLMGIGMTIAEV